MPCRHRRSWDFVQELATSRPASPPSEQDAGAPVSCHLSNILMWDFLERVDVGLAGADAQGLFNRSDKNFAVADLSRPRGGGERFHDLVDLLACDGDLEAKFRKEIHSVFGATVDFRVALLPPVAFDLGHSHALDAEACQCLTNLVEFEGLDDGDDQLHGVPPCALAPRGFCCAHRPCRTPLAL